MDYGNENVSKKGISDGMTNKWKNNSGRRNFTLSWLNKESVIR